MPTAPKPPACLAWRRLDLAGAAMRPAALSTSEVQLLIRDIATIIEEKNRAVREVARLRARLRRMRTRRQAA